MTRDEIIKLVAETADQTRIDPISVADQTFLLDISEVERFAALVEQRAVAAEREACAKIAEEWPARVVAAAIRARGE